MPAVVACPDVTALPEGVTVMVDGGSGVVRVDPTAEDLADGDQARALVVGQVDLRHVAGHDALVNGLVSKSR